MGAQALRTFAYHQNVLDHYNNPRNVGSLDKKASDVGTGLVGAPACGDVMKLQIKVGEDGVIEKAVFKTFGCGSAIASSSYATEILEGKNIEDAMNIKNTDIAEHLILANYCGVKQSPVNFQTHLGSSAKEWVIIFISVHDINTR